MKTTLLTVLFFCASVFSASAQDYEMPENEIMIGGGVPTATLLAESLGDVLSGDTKTNGAYSFTYLHNLNKRFSVGASAVFEDIYCETKTKKVHSDYLSIMPTARAYWFRGKTFGMYSRLAVGVSFDFYKKGATDDDPGEDATAVDYAFQASAVCLEVGSNKVSGFLELGYGYQGIFQVGVKFGL